MKLPASDTERSALIRELLHIHDTEYRRTGEHADVENTSYEQYNLEFLLATPIGLILLIVERFLLATRAGMNEAKQLVALHSHMGETFSTITTSWPIEPLGSDLYTYIQNFVRLLYGTNYVLSDDFVCRAIDKVKYFYIPSGTSVVCTPYAQNVTDNSEAIAMRLLKIESGSPGTVRIKHNPQMMDNAITLLAQIGYKKPFLVSKHQHLFNAILNSSVPLARFLPGCILAGTYNSERFIRCWSGKGRFVGLQGVIQLMNFSDSNKARIPLIFDILPFMDKISDLLEYPPR